MHWERLHSILRWTAVVAAATLWADMALAQAGPSAQPGPSGPSAQSSPSAAAWISSTVSPVVAGIHPPPIRNL